MALFLLLGALTAAGVMIGYIVFAFHYFAQIDDDPF